MPSLPPATGLAGLIDRLPQGGQDFLRGGAGQGYGQAWDKLLGGNVGEAWGALPGAGKAGLIGAPVLAALAMMRRKRKPQQEQEKRAVGAVPAGAALGALIGAARAPSGHRGKGAARGVFAGSISGLGGAVGALAAGIPAAILTRELGSQNPAPAVLAALAGAGAGTYGGLRLSQKMMGKPSWETPETAAASPAAAATPAAASPASPLTPQAAMLGLDGMSRDELARVYLMTLLQQRSREKGAAAPSWDTLRGSYGFGPSHGGPSRQTKPQTPRSMRFGNKGPAMDGGRCCLRKSAFDFALQLGSK